jgi:hypothetical protein
MSDGSEVDVTGLATYSSSDGLVASVSGDGLVSGLLAGLSTITASYGGMTAEAHLSITAPLSLVSITVDGATALHLLQAVQLAATAHYSDGSTQDVTNDATWKSSNTLLGGLVNGLLTALGLGDITVSATFDGVTGSTPIHNGLL